MAVTFPFTPSYVHASVTTYAVDVQEHEDRTEQRVLQSRQRGLRLQYEFSHVSSGLAAGISSFFVAQVGPGIPFTILDHRTQVSHLGRFAENTLEQIRTAPRDRRLVIEFITIQSGATDPIATSFTRPAPPDCTIVRSETAVSTPTIPTDSEVMASSGIIMMVGNTLFTESGADWPYWVQGSSFPGTNLSSGAYYLPLYMHGGLGTTTFESNRLQAIPFITPRSGCTVDQIGIFAMTSVSSRLARIGIYTAASHAQLSVYPGSLLLDCGSLTISSLGLQVLSVNQQLRGDTLYFAAIVTCGTAQNVRVVTISNAFPPLGVGSATNFLRPLHWWEAVHSLNIPSTYPGSGLPQFADYPAITLRFSN